MMKQNNYCHREISISSGWVIALALLLAAPLSLLAQDTGSITGRVSDANTGTNLGGVYITAAGLNTSTDRSGEYVLRGVPAGTQEVNFSYLGYDALSRSVNVTAGQRASLNAVLGTEIIELAEFVVLSQLEGQAKAINAQRVADNIQNIVSADAMGVFPDRSTSDALARLPGLSVRRDQGEGRNIIIRGISANLVAITVNGVSLPTADNDRRAVTLDGIPSDILASMTVTKAVTADMDGDAIGGAIELTTGSAFDREGRFIGGRLEYGYSNLIDEWSPRYGFTYSDIYSVGNGDNNFGVYVGLTWHDRDFGSHGVENDLDDIKFANGDKVLNADGSRYLLGDKLDLRQYFINRTRRGIAINLDYKASESTKYFIRYNHNQFNDTEIRDKMEIDLKTKTKDGADITVIDELSASFTNQKMERNIKDRTQEQSIWVLVAGGEHETGNWKFNYQGSYAFADEIEDDSNNHFWASEKIINLTTQLFENSDQVPTFTVSNLDDYLNADSLIIEDDEALNRKNSLVEDTQWAFKFDATYTTELFGHPGYIKFGVKGRFRDKLTDRREFVYAWEGDDLLLGQFEGPPAIFRHNSIMPFGPTIDTQKVRTFFENNIGPGGFNPNTVDALAESLKESTDADFTIQEDVLAAYIMGKVDIGKLRIVAGVRVEDTDAKQGGFTFDKDLIEEDLEAGGDGTGGGAIQTTSFSKSYTNVLPSIHFRYAHTENLIFRASATSSIVRPIFSDQAPRTNIENEDKEISAGNPALDPYEAINLDLLVEYYMPKLGIISAGIFYKDIDNFIIDTLTDVTGFPGVTDPEDEYELNKPINGDSATVFGFEFNWQQRLDFLPSPFDGLLIGANFTVVDSEAKLNLPDRPTDEIIPLPNQSDTVWNFNVGYEKYGLSLRLAAMHSSRYLDALEDHFNDTAFDNYRAGNTQWDFTASYRLNDRLSIYFEILNIFDEPFISYQGIPRYQTQHESYDWSTTFGLTWNL